MKLSNILENITRYLTEAFARIFGPAEEEKSPPDIGVQPFDCNLYHE
jgi:hypothetical protein